MTLSNHRPLDLAESYPCPVCRHGKVNEMTMMEAFSCELCRHILSADLQKQQVQVVDSSQPLTWSWNGTRWQLVREENAAEISALILFTAFFLTLFPAGLVWLTGLIFPPLPSASAQISFSSFWAILTLLTHLGFVLWLLGEYYQLPFYVAAKLRVLQLQTSRRN